MAKAAAPLTAVPQAANPSFEQMIRDAAQSQKFGATGTGMLNMGGVSYLPATSGGTSYAANSLIVR